MNPLSAAAARRRALLTRVFTSHCEAGHNTILLHTNSRLFDPAQK